MDRGKSTRFKEGRPEASAAGKTGGVRSGEARRKKAAAKTLLAGLLSQPLPPTEKAEELLDKYGLDAEDTAETVMLAALVFKAAQGNVGAIQTILEIMGEDAETTRHAERMKLERERLEVEKQRANGESEQTKLANEWVEALLGMTEQ